MPHFIAGGEVPGFVRTINSVEQLRPVDQVAAQRVGKRVLRPSPTRPSPPRPFAGAIPATATWFLGFGIGTPPIMTPNDGTWYFDFPECAQATRCSVNYVQTALRARLKEGQTITMTFEITGDNPVFDYRTSPNNICGSGTPGTLSLYVQRAGDNLSGSGPYAFFRWYALPEATPLALGSFTFSVPLDASKWVPVYGGTAQANARGFAEAIADTVTVGFVLGGGCFAGHGIAVTSGKARLTLKSYIID